MDLSSLPIQAPVQVHLHPGHPDVEQGFYLYYQAGATPAAFAMVICPGGGYQQVSMDHEGMQVATWFNQMGIDAYVLRYRVSTPRFTYRHPDQLSDLKTTIAAAKATHAQVGVMGFSAGGHLAGMGLTEKENGLALGILVYPVITARRVYWHEGSFQNLFGGEQYEQQGLELASIEKRIGSHTPPLWLMHCHDDDLVPVGNSLLAFEAIQQVQPASQLALYQQGGHGFGMWPLQSDAKVWLQDLQNWLRKMGVL